MSYFSVPLADAETTLKIIKLIQKDKASLKRGISACTKSILNNEEGILIIASDVSPEDLVSHMPTLAEEKKVPYIFVSSMTDLCETNEYLKPTACCFIPSSEKSRKTMKSVLKQSHYQQ